MPANSDATNSPLAVPASRPGNQAAVSLVALFSTKGWPMAMIREPASSTAKVGERTRSTAPAAVRPAPMRVEVRKPYLSMTRPTGMDRGM